MKKIFIGIFIFLVLFTYISQHKVSANIGDCCDLSKPCNTNETCTGKDINKKCAFTLPGARLCEGKIGSCSQSSDLCDLLPDNCCNKDCKDSGDPFPYDYTCGGIRNPNYNPNKIPTNDPTCNDGEGINTAIGCIPVNDTNDFMGWILGWAIGIGGGIAFLLIVYASFMTMTSQGNPERLKAGQELLTSAVSGLILLIFSVFILKFIGLDILKLGGFGFGQ